jgi:hypothetical protein
MVFENAEVPKKGHMRSDTQSFSKTVEFEAQQRPANSLAQSHFFCLRDAATTFVVNHKQHAHSNVVRNDPSVECPR